METNTADVKGVAGITNDVLMAAQAISVPLRPESPAPFGACAHAIKGPRAIHRSLTKGKLEPGLHPAGPLQKTEVTKLEALEFYHGRNEEGMKDNAFSLPLPHPFSCTFANANFPLVPQYVGNSWQGTSRVLGKDILLTVYYYSKTLFNAIFNSTDISLLISPGDFSF